MDSGLATNCVSTCLGPLAHQTRSYFLKAWATQRDTQLPGFPLVRSSGHPKQHPSNMALNLGQQPDKRKSTQNCARRGCFGALVSSGTFPKNGLFSKGMQQLLVQCFSAPNQAEEGALIETKAFRNAEPAQAMYERHENRFFKFIVQRLQCCLPWAFCVSNSMILS